MLIKTKISPRKNNKESYEFEEKEEMQESDKVKSLAEKSGTGKGMLIALLVAYIVLGGLAYKAYLLKQKIAVVEKSVVQMEDKIAQRVDYNRRIYVYNMEETLAAIGIQESSQKFENDIASLEKEVADAQEKIKTIKEAQVKEEFSEMYLRSLQMRRDELVSKYTESMENVLNAINSALEEVARENNVHTVFLSSALALSTDYVVNITPQVIEKVKQQLDKKNKKANK